MLGWVKTNYKMHELPNFHDVEEQTYVDRGVVLCVEANGEVDELIAGRETRRCICIVLHKLNLVAGADTALDENTWCTEGACGEDDATIGRERDDAVGSERRVVGLNTSNLRAVANDVGDEGEVLVDKVFARRGGLEVCCNGTATLAVDELGETDEPRGMQIQRWAYRECAVAHSMVLVVGVIVDRDVLVALVLEHRHYDVSALREVTLSISGCMVRAGDALLELIGERAVVAPALRPANRRREVSRVGVPVESTVDGGTTAKEAASEYGDILAPPVGVGIGEHRLELSGDIELGQLEKEIALSCRKRRDILPLTPLPAALTHGAVYVPPVSCVLGPPRSSRSTFLPVSESRSAAMIPAGPAPTMI